MTRFKVALLCGALISAISASTPLLNYAQADEMPASGSDDSRMRYIAYDAGQVVHLSTTVGSTLVVGFSPTETVTAVAETDTIHLAAIPKGNYLFFKPSALLPLQPIIVLTQRPDGSLRRYVFEMQTVADPTTANGADGVFYSVQFTYPADVAAAALADRAERWRLYKITAAKAAASAASALLAAENTNPFIGDRNYRYVAQGDKSLTPVIVFDNGYSTVFQFPGNERIPSIFVVDPDGMEATASYSVTAGNVEVGQTAREFRLRDGGTVLNVYNLGYNTVGQNPGTGTTSPDISRIVTGDTEKFAMTGNPSPVEDGKSAVAGTPGRQMSIGTKAGVFGLVGVIALGYIGFNAMLSHRPVVIPAAAATNAGAGQTYNSPPNALIKLPPVAMPAPTTDQAAFPGAPQQTPTAAPILEFSGAQNAASVPAAPADAGNAGADPAAVLAGADNSPLADKLKATVLSGKKATVIQNPDMVITEGTLIPCVLQTAIDSELPGLVDCVVPIDIRGSTGSVVLLDRGTKIVGQLQSGPMQGQNRVFVDWTRAETPEHVIVELDSPGADELGRSGLPGAVDNHFLSRFGGALMLTFVQGALEAGTAVAGNSGGGTSGGGQAALGFVYAGQSNGQQVANTALQNTINIQPTLTKNQGDTVSLFVAHDLDFSGVYQLQVNGTSNGAAIGTGNGNGG